MTLALEAGSLLSSLRMHRRWHIYPTKVRRGGRRNRCREGGEVRKRDEERGWGKGDQEGFLKTKLLK